MILGRRSAELLYDSAYENGRIDGEETAFEVWAEVYARLQQAAQEEIDKAYLEGIDAAAEIAREAASSVGEVAYGDPGDECKCADCQCVAPDLDPFDVLHDRVDFLAETQVTNVTALLERIEELGQRVTTLETKPKRKSSKPSTRRR